MEERRIDLNTAEGINNLLINCEQEFGDREFNSSDIESDDNDLIYGVQRTIDQQRQSNTNINEAGPSWRPEPLFDEDSERRYTALESSALSDSENEIVDDINNEQENETVTLENASGINNGSTAEKQSTTPQLPPRKKKNQTIYQRKN